MISRRGFGGCLSSLPFLNGIKPLLPPAPKPKPVIPEPIRKWNITSPWALSQNLNSAGGCYYEIQVWSRRDSKLGIGSRFQTALSSPEYRLPEWARRSRVFTVTNVSRVGIGSDAEWYIRAIA